VEQAVGLMKGIWQSDVGQAAGVDEGDIEGR